MAKYIYIHIYVDTIVVVGVRCEAKLTNCKKKEMRHRIGVENTRLALGFAHFTSYFIFCKVFRRSSWSNSKLMTMGRLVGFGLAVAACIITCALSTTSTVQLHKYQIPNQVCSMYCIVSYVEWEWVSEEVYKFRAGRMCTYFIYLTFNAKGMLVSSYTFPPSILHIHMPSNKPLAKSSKSSQIEKGKEKEYHHVTWVEKCNRIVSGGVLGLIVGKYNSLPFPIPSLTWNWHALK